MRCGCSYIRSVLASCQPEVRELVGDVAEAWARAVLCGYGCGCSYEFGEPLGILLTPWRGDKLPLYHRCGIWPKWDWAFTRQDVNGAA